MTKFIIIDGPDISRFNAKTVEAWKVDPVAPLKIIRVACVDPNEVIIHTDRRVLEIEGCLDAQCKHLRGDNDT